MALDPGAYPTGPPWLPLLRFHCMTTTFGHPPLRLQHVPELELLGFARFYSSLGWLALYTTSVPREDLLLKYFLQNLQHVHRCYSLNQNVYFILSHVGEFPPIFKLSDRSHDHTEKV